MEKPYRTWECFREALEKEDRETYPEYFWDMLRQTLAWSAVHEPFSDGDIILALAQIKRLKRFWFFARTKPEPLLCKIH